ncbi:MAG TPA: aminoglycoside adenylyltransferase domain-containing protein [Ktedonobacteraceae bacterium]|nr:aminoglycoside adenylyltransferase domain-containing protein [Ktedonobacteraceae bacterium]
MSKILPTPYPELNSVLRDAVDGVQEVLDKNFVGAYLQGSFAVGDFDLHSDVDFIVVVEKELSHVEVQALQIMHERIYCIGIPWAQHLEGSYFPRETLRHSAHNGGQLWYLDHGSRALIRSDHCNTILVRWVVRENGVTLAGPPPATLVDPIAIETLRKEILATIHDWGQEIITHPEPYNNRFYQTYIVLNYCRMLHDLSRGFPGSKRAGAEWAKANLDPVWTGLIDRAWGGRPNPAVSVRQLAHPEDFKDTLEFVQYCSNKAHSLYRSMQ